MGRALFAVLVLLAIALPAFAVLDADEIAALKDIRTAFPSLETTSYYQWTDTNIAGACGNWWSSTSLMGVTCGYANGGYELHVTELSLSTSYPRVGNLTDIASGLKYLTKFTWSSSSTAANNYIDDFINKFINVTDFTLSYSSSSYSAVPLQVPANISAWTKLERLSVGYYYGTDLPLLNLPNLKTLTYSTYYGFYSGMATLPNRSPFPEGFFNGVFNLTSLSVSTGSSGMNTLPDISPLTKLQTLDLTSNNLTTLPDVFHLIPDLLSLQVDSNPLFNKFPDTLSTCSKLRDINAYGTSANRDDSYFDMTNTQVYSLNLQSTGIVDVPSSLCQLSRRPYGYGNITLYLDYNKVRSFPSCFSDNSYLSYLTMTGSNFTTFPTVVTNLPGLTYLQLQTNIQTMSIVSADFSNMKMLVSMDLSNSKIYGGFPVSIRNCPKLSTFSANGNSFQGSLADDFFNGTALVTFYIGESRMNGAIPSSFYRLTNFAAYDNRFTSLPNPSAYGLSSPIRYIDLTDNRLTALPSNAELSTLLQLRTFYVGGNGISGALPTFWTAAPSVLQYGNFSYNSFTGPFPSLNSSIIREIYVESNSLSGAFSNVIKATNLRVLSASRNNLVGGIPNSIGDPTNGALQMTTFDVSFNEMSGNLPPQFGSLTSLSIIRINNNGFRGNLPNLSAFTSLNRFYAQNNFFSLCAVNPGFYSISKTYCNLTNQLFPNACECPSFYTSCNVDTLCPGPDYVPIDAPLGPAPTPIKAPTAGHEPEPVFVPFATNPDGSIIPQAPTDEIGGPAPTGDSSRIAVTHVALFSVALIAALLI